jgi:hypothetical protein
MKISAVEGPNFFGKLVTTPLLSWIKAFAVQPTVT